MDFSDDIVDKKELSNVPISGQKIVMDDSKCLSVELGPPRLQQPHDNLFHECPMSDEHQLKQRLAFLYARYAVD